MQILSRNRSNNVDELHLLKNAFLSRNRSNNVDELHLLKNAFRRVGEAAIAFDFKKCCTASSTPAGAIFPDLNTTELQTTNTKR